MRLWTCFGLHGIFAITGLSLAAASSDLRIGIAGHAFDHLGGFAEQDAAAAASGANIIYVTGLGGTGYSGLPVSEDLQKQRDATATYVRRAKQRGIKLAIGYVCATSIVKLDQFDRNWSADFRSRFATTPPEWRQQDRDGKPLPSWYGGDYVPACMNNPDWRAYERFVVRQQLESGCDGIFFDNPTVHPQGCYCAHCMKKFAEWLQQAGRPAPLGDKTNLTALYCAVAAKEHDAFLQFRCTIARDFLQEMRQSARKIKAGAMVTANNSLNSADVLYSQCRSYAYNIHELSKAGDFVVVEDMSSQPRTLGTGRTIEYGPTYKQLAALSHGKPVVAVTIADADYHTPPNLVRLAMAEAAANQASHLWWPTWPEDQRERMASTIRPQADFLRRHADLLNGGQPRPDVILFLPFRNWLKGDQCKASAVAAELSRANIQYQVVCEDAFETIRGSPEKKTSLALSELLQEAKVFLVPAAADLTAEEQRCLQKLGRSGGTILTADKPGWLDSVRTALGEPSVIFQGPSQVRVVVQDQPKRTLVHLLNLNVQRLTAFTDQIIPAQHLELSVRVPFRKVHSVRLWTADAEASSGPLKFSTLRRNDATRVEIHVPRLEISAIVVLE